MIIIYVRDNLIMRSLTKDDAPASYAVIDGNRAYLRKWLPWLDGTNSHKTTEDVISSWEKDYEAGSDIVAGIFENGAYCGNIGLHRINSHNKSGMIGYWLAEDRQGCGIITDCVRALTNVGFYTLGLNRIYIHCAVENNKSRAVPERLGYVQEGIMRDGECLYGVYHDMVLYGLLQRDWDKNETKGDALYLGFPRPVHKDAAADFRREHIENGEAHIHGGGGLLHENDYENWLDKITRARTAGLTGWVDCSTFFAFVGEKIVGTIQIRHTLNEMLMNYGGHIGFGVRPSERRKGYGSKMLALALRYCDVLGIVKALVTCDKENAASANTIIKNGGVQENEYVDETGSVVKRFWITVK